MKLKHLEHVEDYVLTGNYMQAVDTIGTLCDELTGRGSPHLKVTTKYDGAPSIVFGVNPANNKFFVGTKAVFNKTPKICYNEEDINFFHGDQPELVAKLHLALDTLNFEYNNGGMLKGVFQGDILFTRDSVKEDNRTVFFTPNTITYRCNKEQLLGMEVRARPLGMVVHTVYEGETLETMEANFNVDHSKFLGFNVVFINPNIKTNDYLMTQLQYDTIVSIVNFCDTTALTMSNRSIYTSHGKFLKMFINHCIRMGEPSPELSMYEVFLRNRGEDDLNKEVEKHRREFVGILMMHKYVTQAKKIILRILNSTAIFFHEANGHPTDGEGFVVIYHGVPCKLVDRMEFSKLNFANKRFVKS